MRTFSSAFHLIPIGLGIAAMFVAPHAPAQTFKVGEVTVLGLVASGCPVVMTAQQRSMTHQVYAGGAVPNQTAQGLTVAMSDSRALRITTAEVVAHALSPRSRAVLTSSEDDADVARTFQLTAKDERGFRSNLWMKGVTSIRWIEVKSLTYSNGSVWHESETRKCIVRPDPFVLVSSAR